MEGWRDVWRQWEERGCFIELLSFSGWCRYNVEGSALLAAGDSCAVLPSLPWSCKGLPGKCLVETKEKGKKKKKEKRRINHRIITTQR